MLSSLSSRVKASLLCLLTGVIYLVVAPLYAKLAYAAPVGSGRGSPSTLEVTFAIPAVCFAIMGVLGLVFGTVMLLNHVDDN